MNTTTMLFLRSDPAMYVCTSRRSRPCLYVRTWPYFLSCTLAIVRTCTCYVRASTSTRARLYYDTCVPLHRPVCTYTFATRMTMLLRFDQVGPGCQALPCLRRCSWWVPAVRGANRFFARTHFLACKGVASGSQQSGGKHFFHEIRWPIWWVPAVRWRNNYFARNKEALPCCGRGPNFQRLHAQYSSDGSRLVTT